MKKLLFLAAGAALVMSSCSQSEDTSDLQSSVQLPVEIGARYIVSNVQTRAGETGTMTTETLQKTGFGVFCYYSDASDYSTSLKPNFMYNQKVEYSDNNWTYSPVKYWPNETAAGDADKAGQDPAAQATGADKLSFFAYAPYVNEASGDEGITGMTANNVGGDPKITYKVASKPENSVDLLWAVVGSDNTAWENVTGEDVTLTEGLPYLNLIKPDVSQKVNLLFKHALSKFQLKVVGAFDKVDAGGEKDDATKITIAKVEITGLGGGTEGVLNLNNDEANVPNWTVSDATATSMTIEGEAINAELLDGGAKVQTVEGVTGEEKPLLAQVDDEDVAYMVIPGSSNVTVKITYYTTTEDANLADGYSRVENVITKDISGLALEAGKSYNLKIILGMTTVKLEATVEEWDDDTTESVINLPINVE